MARREWNVARSGQFGRLPKSAVVRRNPHEYAGTGASTREPARSGKKKPQPRTVGVLLLVETASTLVEFPVVPGCS